MFFLVLLPLFFFFFFFFGSPETPCLCLVLLRASRVHFLIFFFWWRGESRISTPTVCRVPVSLPLASRVAFFFFFWWQLVRCGVQLCQCAHFSLCPFPCTVLPSGKTFTYPACFSRLSLDRCGAPELSSGRGLSRARRGTDIHDEWSFHCEWRPLFSFCQRAPRLSTPSVCRWCVEGRGAAVWPER